MAGFRTQSDVELDRLKSEWSWERIYACWQRHAAELLSDDHLGFVTVPVHDPKHPTNREPAYCWWPRAEIKERQLDFQRHLDKHPGTIVPVHDFSARRGEIDTVGYLLAARGNRPAIAAILLAASLFSRTESSRAHYPREYWPPWLHASHVRETAVAHCESMGLAANWHFACTDVLPYSSADHYYKLDDVSALIRYLADEHIKLFLQYALVEIVFDSHRDPFVEKVLAEEYRQREEQARQWKAQFEREQKAREEEENLRRQKHPRSAEWSSLPREELQRLVWNLPTVQVAALFGVSDVAIGKRCKTLGIPKPTTGFWRKVEVGLTPHPNGKPIEISRRKPQR